MQQKRSCIRRVVHIPSRRAKERKWFSYRDHEELADEKDDLKVPLLTFHNESKRSPQVSSPYFREVFHFLKLWDLPEFPILSALT